MFDGWCRIRFHLQRGGIRGRGISSCSMVQDQVPSAERGDQRERHLELFDGWCRIRFHLQRGGIRGRGISRCSMVQDQAVCREGGSEGEASRDVRRRSAWASIWIHTGKQESLD